MSCIFRCALRAPDLSSFCHKAITQAGYNGGESRVHEEAITMNKTRRLPTDGSIPLRWMTRLLSLVINIVFLLILCLAVMNEDKPQGPAITVLVLLALTVAASFAAWRWERSGGALVVAGGVCLGAAAYSASLAFGLGSFALLGTFTYGAPFVLVGILFWISGGRVTDGSTE